MHRLLPLLLLSALAWASTEPSAAPSSPTTSPHEAAPEQVLAAIDARANALHTIRYGVVRTTERDGTVVEERWRFAMEGPERFRIDYSGDTQRQIIRNGDILLDYVPALRGARRYDLSRMSGAEAQQVMSAILSKVALPGLRTGFDPDMSWSWGELVSVGTLPGRAIHGTDVAGGKVDFVIDPEGRFLLRSEIRTGESFVASIRTSDHLEVVPGTWVPRAVEMKTPAEGGIARVTLRVNAVAAGEAIPDSALVTDLVDGISVEDVP